MSEPAPHPASPDPAPGNSASGDAAQGDAAPSAEPRRLGRIPNHALSAPVPVVPAEPPAPAPREPGFSLVLDAATLNERARGVPVLGGLAVIFGVSALFKAPLALGPLAIGFGLAALFRRQAALGAIGGISGLVGLLISPLFWALIGLGWLSGWLWGWLVG